MASALLNHTFNGGLISPLMVARPDQKRYQSGCFELLNAVCIPQGPATRRPGMLYKGLSKEQDEADNVRVVPFVFSSTEARVLEFGPGYIRVWKDDALVKAAAQNISGITKANPAVVTYDGADTYANGDQVYISGVVGMTEVNGRIFTIANVVAGSNTFELAGVDSTGYTAYTSGGTAEEIYTVATSYTSAEIPLLQFAQSADVVYIASPSRAPAKLARTADNNWTLSTPTFVPAQAAPTSLSATPATAGSQTFKYVVSAISGTTGEESVPCTEATCTSAALSATNHVDLSWTGASGAGSYRIYRYNAGVYGFIGISSGTTFVDDGISPDETDTPISAENPFSGSGNYPRCVFFWQQRLGWASTDNKPFGIWLSQSAQLESLASSTPPVDDDAIEKVLATDKANRIQWVAADRALVMGTTGNEWLIGAADGTALTPANTGFNRQGGKGSEAIPALATGDALLFVQRGGRSVLEFSYSFTEDRYKSPDLSIVASHLFDDRVVSSWCYQLNPFSIVWAVMDDGTFLGLTYMREHEVIGWHEHETDGVVESMCSVPGANGHDEVWAVVWRDIDGVGSRFIERFGDFFLRQSDPADAMFLDCAVIYDGAAATVLTGLAPHLAGETVSIWADGAEQPERAVDADGTVTLDTEASYVVVGLPFTSDIRPARPEVALRDGTTIGRVMKVSDAVVRFYRSMGVKVGPDEAGLYDVLVHDASDPADPAIRTGDETVTIDTGWTSEWGFLIRSDSPGPMTVLAVVYNAELGDVP